MHYSKTILKKTKRGNVLRVVKEHYLRDDIGFGSELITQTGEYKPEHKPLLKEAEEYLILDTDIIMHQMDAIENSNALQNVVILQTVLDSIRLSSINTYRRIRKVISDPNRHFFVFSNEHHRLSYVHSITGESPFARNQRAIRKAASLYTNVFNQKIKIVFITNDLENLKKAQDEGIFSETIYQYASRLKNYPEFVDMLVEPQKSEKNMNIEKDNKENKENKDNKENQENFLYPQHLTKKEIFEGISKGKYYQGTIHINPNNFYEAFVNCEGYEESFIIQGRKNINRAVDRDIVAIELFPKDQKVSLSSKIIEHTNEEDEDIMIEKYQEKEKEETEENLNLNLNKNQNQNNNKNRKSQLQSAKIVGIIKRNWRQYCGSIQLDQVFLKQGGRFENLLFIPVEKRIPKIRIKTRQVDALLNKRIVVVIDSWERNSRYPNGHYIKTLGDIGDKEVESEVILIEHEVPHESFCEDVLKCLPLEQENWQIPQEEIAKRKDLRNLCIISIDPPGCKDIDDCLHVRNLDNGNYEVGVHIADVSYFVKEGTPIDIEAANRSTTVYLVDRRINMLPPLFGENLCSLHQNIDRLTFSVIWELNEKAEIIQTWFGKTVICSKAALSYGEAQLRKDDPKMKDEITESIRTLNKLSKYLEERRKEAGALTLASPEVHFSMDSETQEPLDVEVYQHKEVNHLVEEFMLLANISVAERIFEYFPQSALLRRHPSPIKSQFDNLLKSLENFNLSLDISSPKNLSKSLDKAIIKNNPYFNKLLRILTTRSMTQAVYFASGTLDYKDFFHFGLAAPIYTHFTSPIRRYADVCVHRLLASSLDIEAVSDKLTRKESVHEICKVINYRHRMAQEAGRASVSLYTLIFFKDKEVEEEGFIINVKKNAFIVLVPKYGIEGIIYVIDPTKEDSSPFTFNQERQELVYNNYSLRVFDKVVVLIDGKKCIQHNGKIRVALSLIYPFQINIPKFIQEQKDQKIHNM